MKVPFLQIAGLLIPVVSSIPLLNVDVHITDDTHGSNSPATSSPVQHVLDQTPGSSPATMAEKIPGWVFFEQDRFRARIHGNTFWNIKGTLDDKFPLEDFLFDPLVFTLSHPQDFAGNFTGKIGQGEISLAWDQSGATINGRSPVGDFEIKGQTYVDYAP